MKDLLEEQRFQITGCVEQACAVEIGRLLGARKMVIGSVGKVGDTFTVSLRMVDVETELWIEPPLRTIEVRLMTFLLG